MYEQEEAPFCWPAKAEGAPGEWSVPLRETSSLPGFPGGVVVKNPTANAGDERDVGLIPRSGRSPGEENGTPVHYSCLENSMDRGALVGCSR